MRAPRALLFVVATTLAACGGFLGFGDDPDDPPAPPSDPDASVTAETGSDPSSDAGDDVTGVVTSDGGIDAPDKTPVDGGPEILVLARFESKDGVEGIDGADVANNMLQSKTDAINGQSARTNTERPASLGWTFAPQSQVFIAFSLRILAMPAGAGAELASVTGSGSAVSLLIGKSGTFALRTGTVDLLGPTMSVDTSYRVGIVISANSNGAAAGFVALGDKLATSLDGPWTPGTIDALQIRTGNTQFAYVIDDVVVSTTAFQ